MNRRVAFLLLSAAALFAIVGCDWGGDWTDGVWLVDASAPDGGDGKSWATAFQHPQDAVDAASAGDEAWVAGGTYTRRDAADEVVLTMKDGVAIYGGFAGTETVRGERDWETNVTTLDGEKLCYHVIVGASDTTFDGFTVTRGKTVWDGDNASSGGGMWNIGVTGLALSNCVFTDNSAESGFGGAVFNIDSTVTLTDVTVMGNSAKGGGGVHSTTGWPGPEAPLVLRGCTFSGNSSVQIGGGCTA
jgi:predicted outer membrane repeat protein